MPTPTIPAGNLFMNATTYTGTGAAQSITNGVAGQSFQPDLVWIKTRSTVQNHSLIDSVRGNTKILYSDLTNAEGTFSGVLDSFNSNGFTLGSSASVNQNGTTFVGWNWKAGGAAVSNTSGTITSSVSANTTSGFSVVTYTGTGANATVGHGLGVAPSMVIVKTRSLSSQNWQVYHSALGQNKVLQLDLATSVDTITNYWFNGTTSTVFGVNGSYSGINSNGATYVAYCWAPIAGYSAFGSYTGNGSADGPFVYTGFRPRFVIFKGSSVADQWHMLDTSRSTYNSVSSAMLYANLSAAEADYSAYPIDFLSNGFKFRTSAGFANESAGTYIYMAFAENPFKYANAR